MSIYHDCCICRQMLTPSANQCPNCGRPNDGFDPPMPGQSVDIASRENNARSTVDDIVMPESRNDCFLSVSGCNNSLCREAKTADQFAKLQCEANTLQDARKSIRRAMEADEARKQRTAMEIVHENLQEVKVAIKKQHQIELIEAADRRKLLEEEAAAMLKQQEINALECTRRMMQFEAARRRREQDLVNLEWRKRTAEQAAAQAAIRRTDLANCLGQIRTCPCYTNSYMCDVCDNPRCQTKSKSYPSQVVEHSEVQWNPSSPLQEYSTRPGCCGCAMASPKIGAVYPTEMRSSGAANSQGGFSASGKIISAEINTNWVGPATFQGSCTGPVKLNTNTTQQPNRNFLSVNRRRRSSNVGGVQTHFNSSRPQQRQSRRPIKCSEPNRKKSRCCTIQ